MSDRRVRRLALVRDEYDAAREALAYLNRNWNRLQNVKQFRGIGRPDVREALANLEDTYIVRLTIELENMLRSYYVEHQPALRVPRNTETIVNRIARFEAIPDPIRDKVHEVRNYRNYFVHGGGLRPEDVSFSTALANLAKYVSRMPD